MQPLELQDRAQFPNLSLLRASAADFGLGDAGAVAESVCLGAILGAALSFGSEAEEGAFSSIFLVYGQADSRVSVTLTGARQDGYRLVIERISEKAPRAFAAGLSARSLGVGTPWLVEAAHVGGKPVAASEFLDSLTELRGLVLVAKEVSDRLSEAA